MQKIAIIILSLFTLSFCPAKAQNPVVGDHYLFCHMAGNGEWTAYAVSDDGEHWEDLLGGGPVFDPEEHARIEGGTRDAYICRSHDKNRFLMVTTDMANHKTRTWWNYGIDLLVSDDLIHWTSTTFDFRKGAEVFCDPDSPDPYKDYSTIRRVWAPQIIWDKTYRWPDGKKGGYFIYYSILNDVNGEDPYDRMYYSYADESFTQLTKPRLFLDWGYATIDCDINYLKTDRKFHMMIKKEGGKPGLFTATADKLTGPWTTPVDDDYVSFEGNRKCEGVSAFQLKGEDGWRIGYIQYSTKPRHYRICRADKYMRNFSDPQDIKGVAQPQHGSFLRITKAEYDRLRAWAYPQQRKAISADLFGIFFEDINYAADGGLYAELVQNRSFEYSLSDVSPKNNEQATWNPFTAWHVFRDRGTITEVSLETAQPLNDNNRHYALVSVKRPGAQGGGLTNTGYDGIAIRQGERYRCSFFARGVTANGYRVRLMAGGKTVAEQTGRIEAGPWKRYEMALAADTTAHDASLQVLFTERGDVALDMVSLFPENTFKNRPNGLRRDLAQAIADLHPAFMRFPGGCLAHGDGRDNIYRWKESVGPVEQRRGQRNIWGYHQSLGFGYHEFLQFCEDIGAKPLPVLAAGVSCQNSAWIGGHGQEPIPMDEMDAYIQDVLDLVEYCNGPVTSTWGRKRAEAGHPEPFNLEYIGIGNEDVISPAFEERFNMIYKKVHARYPDLKVVGTAGWNSEGEDWEKGWALARRQNFQLIDEHYYKPAQWFLDNLHRYDTFSREGTKVYIGEYASKGNRMENAIAEATYLTGVERNGDVVSLSSYAPLLARNGHTQWRTDLIYFDGQDYYPTVNYYVQQLFGQNAGDYYWSGIVSGTESASCVEDRETGDIILKLVNTTDNPLTATCNLKPFKGLKKTATLTVLKGEKQKENNRGRHAEGDIKPEASTISVAKTLSYEMPANSLTVIRIGKNNN